MSKRKMSIEIRDVSPGAGAVRLTGNRAGGGSEGFHTGGAWLYQNKVWKPLDGRPYGNADFHIETEEEACLTALQGKLLFPKNWEIKEVNSRRFLVRDLVPTFPNGSLRLSLNDIYEIEKGLIEMNRLKWEVNDDLVIGKDRSNRLFIVDLSAAQYTTGSGAQAADDSLHFNKLCEQAGFREIPALKAAARELSVQVTFNRNFKETGINRRDIKYFYSSESKVDIKNTVDLTYLISSIPPKDRQVASKYFWIGSTKPLSNQDIRVHKMHLRHFRRGT
jgi:hypothetical protein